MKFWLRSLFGAVLALGFAAAAQAQSLGISAVTVDNAAPKPGDTVTYTITVINNSTTTGYTSNTVDIDLTLTNQVTAQVINLTPTDSVTLPDLGFGATTDVKISKTIPLSTSQAGGCKVTAVMAGTFANATFTTSAAILTITGKPDLKITSLTYPAGTAYKGGDVIPMQLQWTNLLNSGVNNVPYVPNKNGDNSFFRIEVIISSNPTFGDGDDFLLTSFDVSGDPATDNVQNADGANRTINWNQLLPGNFAGSYYVMAKIDALSGVSEAIDNDLSINGNNTWFGETNAARINLLPTNFPTDYWASSAGNGYSDNPALSADGRYVAFASDSTNLGTSLVTDTNNVRDIFLYDNQTSTVRRINLSQQGAQANGASATPAISSTGRYVAFSSEATNLVVGDTNGFSDIYFVDSFTGSIALVSVSTAGTQANGSSFKPSISADGRYIVFESSATNLIAGGTSVGVTHIYLRDRNVDGRTDATPQANPIFDVAGNTATYLIDRADTDTGVIANGNSLEAKISGDGTLVVFASDATNLVVAADNNNVRDIFARTVGTDLTTRVSVRGVTEANGASHAPSVSADGRYVAFGSTATNLIASDTNGVSDIFVYDRTGATTTRVSISTAGVEATDPSGAGFKLGSINPSISENGRYVTFASLANNLTAGDGGGQTQSLIITNGGSGYSSNPTVTLTGPGGANITATATATINGSVTGIAVTAPGSGYATAPTVYITGGGGAGATAVAATDGNAITGITVTNPGSGYTSAPTVSLTGGGGTGATATAAVSGPVTVVNITNPGNGYTTAPTVSFAGGGGTGAAATAFVNSNGYVTGPDANDAVDVFVVDRAVNGSTTYDTPGNIATSIVSVNRFGYQTQQLLGIPSSAASDIYPVISADGRWVALPSDAENTAGLVHGANNRSSPDLNTFRDVFLHDRRTNALPGAATLPTVTIAVQNPVLVNTAVSVTASATTTVSGGVISSVAFYVNGTLLGTSTDFPYSTTWTPHAVGTFTLSALATDNFGNVGVSINVPVTVNAAPGVSITSPTANSTISIAAPTPITATAAATTPGAQITSVQFYANGVPVGGPDNSAPYSVSWSPVVAGSYTLTAVAIDDNSTQATSAPVVVTVTAVPSTLPVVVITSPVDGFQGLKNVAQNITATATSATSTINKVDFAIDGAAFGTVTTYPYTLPWTPTTTGTFVITATATDNLGGQATATSTVTIGVAPEVEFVAPVIVSPATAAVVAVNTPTDVTVTAEPTGATIVRVEFFANGAPLATVTTFPYTTVWTPTATGDYVLTAVATDTAGNQGSNTRNVKVSGGTPPTVTITSPADDTTFAVGDTISFSAQTALGSGLINNFKWFVNGIRVQEVIVTPGGQSGGAPPFFNFQWAAAAAGTYYITGVATDSSGNVATSGAVKVTVSAAAAAPMVSITSPVGATLPATTDIPVNTTQIITASATSVVAIASVEFFANGRSIGVDTQFPYSVAWTPTGTGAYNLSAVGTDNLGSQTTSEIVSVNVTAGDVGKPFVYLTSTPTGTNVAVNTPVVISANAGDPDGTVTSVQFYVNGQVVGSSATVPYHTVWVPVVAGPSVITAVVTDNAGNRITSTAATLTAVGAVGGTPLVGIDFNNPAIDVPAPGTTPPTIDPFVPVNVDSGSKLIISALGADADGTIASIRFFANGTSIATDNAAPYYTTYTLSLTDVTLVALVTDNSGNSVYSTPVYIHSVASVGGSTNSVTLVSPVDGATYFAGAQIVFSATHNYGNVNPPKIDFYVDGQQFTMATTAPYQSLVGLTKAGEYDIHAVVRSGTSTTVSNMAHITVESNDAPEVALTSPANNAQYGVGTPLTLTANASDTDGTVQSVQFLVNNSLLSTANAAPYTAAWNPGSPGSYSIRALAIDDAGNQTLSDPITVKIVGNAPPVVTITSPVAGEKIAAGTAYILTATAADADGTVASVTFLANGSQVGTATTAPFAVTWRPTANGNYKITALVTDNLGSQSVSGEVSVDVTAVSGPTVSLTSPAAGALPVNVTQILRATAGSTTGAIVSIEFTVNGTSVGVDSIYPYELAWTPAAPGTYIIRAIATDSSNHVATSAATTVTVAAKTAITVISNNGRTGIDVTDITKGSSVILRADPSPGDGVIKQVQFFEDGIALGNAVTTAPFTLVYSPAGGPATHTITVQLTNNNGFAASMSDALNLRVINAATVVPAISTVINNPLDQAKVAIPAGDNSIEVSVDAKSLAGSFITKVELYVEGSLYDSQAYPYKFEWTPTAAGTYHLVALAYDNRNNVVATTTSAVVPSTSVPTTIIVAAPPVVAITTPVDGGTLAGGVQGQVAFTAASSNNYPLDIQLYQDDVYVGGTVLTASGVGTVSYVPTQKTHFDVNNNPVVDLSSLYAIATDPLGFSTKSTVIGNLHITDGGSGGGTTVIGHPPTNVAVTSPVTNTTLKVSAPLTIFATADDDDGNITSVEFRVNNQIVGTLTSYPYYLPWTPTNLGTYYITVKATDNDGNTVISPSVKVTVTDSGPNGTSVAVTSPANGAVFTAGTPTTLKATATDDVSIASVQFYVNGQPLGTPITSLPYNITWNPVAAGAYTIVARATDNVGNQATSATVNVTVNPNAAPSVTLTSPQASTIVAGTAVSLAATASDVDGTVTGVKFFANNVLVGSAAAAPFTASWTPGAAGSYTVLAQATDDSGNVTNSSSVVVTVSSNQAPVAAITAPANGSVIRIGTSTTITANASDADGTVTSVQIIANGTVLATLTTAPYTVTWNPTTEGVYRLTAVATDNSGATSTSAPVTVMASLVNAANSDTVYAGTYAALGEFGNFTAMNLHGRTATFIGYVPESQTQSAAKTYFYTNLPIDASGGFILRDSAGKVLISGTFNETGVSGTFDGGRVTFVGPVVTANASAPVAAGFYSGSVLGRYASVLTGIIGSNGTITLNLQDGTFADSGAGSVDSTGAFTINTRAGNHFVGKADPATGFLSGTLSGASSGTFAAAPPSGNTFSDGFLRNISTRGLAGTGNNVLIAGFVVTGDVPKQILVRAIGPSMQGGLTGLLPDPQIQLYKGSNSLGVPGYNNDWAPGLSSTFSTLGAFALTNGSKDAAVLITLQPGVYSALVSDVNGATGLALVELYDADNQSAFSSQKMVNISTRGSVGTGDNVLIAGFVVNGTAPKKVLVRGIGPGIASALGASALADPIVRIVGAGATIRENDNWEVGNDPTLAADAASRIGATPLAAGSKDAVILMTLPPGVYSAILSGAANGTGIGLIEVYEVP